MDRVHGRADFAHPGADVVADVALDVQVVDGQAGLVGGALDLVFVAGSVDDGLRRWVLKAAGYPELCSPW